MEMQLNCLLRASTSILCATVVAAALNLSSAAAQELKSVKAPETPLVLKARGSFYVGGSVAQLSAPQLGELAAPAPPGTNLAKNADQVTVNQMYVEYMVGERADKIPVILLHGSSLSGKTWDTTPDGRMGWYEYFVRQGHPTYVPDQVGRARSGFDQKVFNDVRTGAVDKASQPSILRLGDNYGVWTNFRVGPSPGVPFANNQFPVEAMKELSKQGIPDLNQLYTGQNPTFAPLNELGKELKGAVLIGHSQGARFPTEAALIDVSSFRALILLEPGNCTTPWGKAYSDEQIGTLAKLPILIVFGDNLSNPTNLAGPNWDARIEDCQRFADRVNAAKGKTEVLHLPKAGLSGNTHMMMQDKNSIEVADLMLKWIDNNTK